MNPGCPFCSPDVDRLFFEDDLVRGMTDAFPLNPGHALIVPRRHIASWFDATDDERMSLLRGVDAARSVALARHRADGFNIGINEGAAAGRTIPHLHVHVIPRLIGDVADPRGGIRWVVPQRAAYWEAT